MTDRPRSPRSGWWAERRSPLIAPRGRPFVRRGPLAARRSLPGSTSRIQSVGLQMAYAYRLLRAASRLGVPGSLPGPPELLPAGARVLAQGYLNRFSMPLLNDWLLPRWMREQSDPACPWFVPRSVTNIMVNQTRRNWTALGIPGAGHPIESLVDRWGLLTPVPGGPSLDWWVDVDGEEGNWMAASRQQKVLQTFQGSLPVVATSYEANGLRVSSEAWMLALPDADYAAMQVVLFNIADLPLKGTFAFVLRPYNSEGISPVYNIAFDGATLLADGSPGPFTWPQPERHTLSGLRSGDLFNAQAATQSQSSRLYDPHGFAHGALLYSFDIEPWEEAEFLAIVPVHTHHSTRPATLRPLFSVSIPPPSQDGTAHTPDPTFYSRAKAATTLEWRSLLGGGMKVDLPHRDLQASWDANRAHVLALHDGDTITPGPDLYHSFWFRDAAYMTNALSTSGHREAAAQLLRGFLRRQRRDGAFVSHLGEWDSTGQALWAIAQHIALYPDPSLLAEFRPAIERGAKWILATLERSPDGLMPPGVASEHFGPPDHYYWDSIWSLAGLQAAYSLPGGRKSYARTAARLRRTLGRAWAVDMAALGRESLVAAPGRGLDLGMIGTLVAWFPLRLIPPDSPLLEGTLSALEETLFYDGALFVNTGHSGWGTYLNMRIAGCRILQGSPKGWEAMQWLLRHASPTYNWPEAIHTRSLGGSAGDGHHGWASAEWLLLVRALLLREDDDRLTLTPALPREWLNTPGSLAVENAPTRFGPLSYKIMWEAGGATVDLELTSRWRTAPAQLTWRLPGVVTHAQADGRAITPSKSSLALPTNTRTVRVNLNTE
ncbi:MAG: hypothetical protein ABI670_22715 [Chloroflexota bacterium]